MSSRRYPLLALIAIFLAAWAPHAVAAPADVIADYNDNGVIDGDYSLQELRGALELAAQTRSAAYGSMANAIAEKQAEALAGVTPRAKAPTASDVDSPLVPGIAIKPMPSDEPTSHASELSVVTPAQVPGPPIAEPGDQVPWPFLVLSVLASVVMLAGIAAAIYRHTRGTGGRHP